MQISIYVLCITFIGFQEVCMDIEKMQGKLEHQKFFEEMFNLALLGMNISRGDKIEYSGELLVLLYLKEIYSNVNISPVFFDVGANIGSYSIAISSIFKDEVSIFAFEPFVNTFNTFKHNTSRIPNVNAFNFGFSDANKQMTLYYDGPNSDMASVYHRQLDYRNIRLDHSEEITMTTIDQFCVKMNIPAIDFLKLDVEGHELSVLLGAKSMIDSNKIQYIQFEFGSCNIDSRTFFKDFYTLLNGRYRLYRILIDGLLEITNYRETLEIFTTTNFLAIHR